MEAREPGAPWRDGEGAVPSRGGRLGLAIAGLWVAIVVARAVVAARLGLHGDEAFYYLCSQHPALAYADHPFMTALWVKAGVSLLGPTPLGVRFSFLLGSALLPFVVYRLARPIVGAADARLAFGASLLVPVLACHGVVALPDGPLLLFAALALHGFERAIATGRAGWWGLAGVAVALGLATHLRFALIPLCFLVYALGFAEGRRAWRSPAAWAAGAVASLGWLPLWLHGARTGFASLRFQLWERHDAGAEGLSALVGFLPWQLVAAGPLFLPLAAVCVAGIARLREQDPSRALLLVFAGLHLGLFLVAAPFADARHVSLHWPAPAYLALVVLLPDGLRRFLGARPSLPRRALAALTPALAVALLVFALLETATGVFGVEDLRVPFAAHERVIEQVRLRLDASDPPALLVADDIALGGSLALAFDRRVPVYVLRHADDLRHGRQGQLERWGIGEEALVERAGETALLVLEHRGRRHRRERIHARSFLEEEGRKRLERVEADLPGKPRVFDLHRGRVTRPPDQGSSERS